MTIGFRSKGAKNPSNGSLCTITPEKEVRKEVFGVVGKETRRERERSWSGPWRIFACEGERSKEDLGQQLLLPLLSPKPFVTHFFWSSPVWSGCKKKFAFLLHPSPLEDIYSSAGSCWFEKCTQPNVFHQCWFLGLEHGNPPRRWVALLC